MIRWLSGYGAFLIAALFIGQARAEPAEADRATARALATEGYRALKRQDYAIAADRFMRADALVHAPTLVVDWARALTGLGMLVEAQEKYELVLREGVSATAPRSWLRAQTDARAELEALRPRLAWITLTVTGSDQPAITIDEAPLPIAALGVPRATNPGRRKIRVEALGYVPETRSVTLAEGARQRLEITLVPRPPSEPSPKPLALPRKSLPPPAPKHDDDSGTQRGLAHGALVVGGVGLAVGSVAGALALTRRSRLESACNGETCPPGQRENVDAYHRLGTASAIGFGVALLGAGTGITLLLTDDSDDGPRKAGLAPYIGLGSVGATGRY